MTLPKRIINFLKLINERIKRALYALFREEINKYLGVKDINTNQFVYLPPKIEHRSFDTEKYSVAVDFNSLDYPYLNTKDTPGISQMIEDAKKRIARDIVESNFIHVETDDLIRHDTYGRKRIILSVFLKKQR